MSHNRIRLPKKLMLRDSQKLRRLVLPLAMLSLALSSPVHAASISSNSVDGSDLFSEDLIYHDQSRALRETGYGNEWKVDLGYSRAVDPLAAQHQIVDQANSITATLGETRNRTRFGASYLFSETPAAYLRLEGPTFYLGEQWNRSGPGPLFDLKTRYSLLRYRTDAAGVLGLEQTEFHIGGSASWTLFSLYAGYGTYHYDQPVNRFLAALSSNKAIRASLAGLRYALYGFPDDATELSLTYTPTGPWQATIEEVMSHVRAPNGTVYATQLLVGRSWHRWNVAAGVEHDRNVQFSDNLGLLNIGYHFDD